MSNTALVANHVNASCRNTEGMTYHRVLYNANVSVT